MISQPMTTEQLLTRLRSMRGHVGTRDKVTLEAAVEAIFELALRLHAATSTGVVDETAKVTPEQVDYLLARRKDRRREEGELARFKGIPLVMDSDLAARGSMQTVRGLGPGLMTLDDPQTGEIVTVKSDGSVCPPTTGPLRDPEGA